ncbi:hypothetical protein GALMADRAFT_272372, partial [Galerina marginata CBS 339.88]
SCTPRRPASSSSCYVRPAAHTACTTRCYPSYSPLAPTQVSGPPGTGSLQQTAPSPCLRPGAGQVSWKGTDSIATHPPHLHPSTTRGPCPSSCVSPSSRP